MDESRDLLADALEALGVVQVEDRQALEHRNNAIREIQTVALLMGYTDLVHAG